MPRDARKVYRTRRGKATRRRGNGRTNGENGDGKSAAYRTIRAPALHVTSRTSQGSP